MNKGKSIAFIMLGGIFTVLYACSIEEPARYDEPAGSGGWLKGDVHEKFDRLADQHGGFSQSMREVGYRYNEMYWAAKDENWEFAHYHADKIRGAMKAGFERRPDREASAENFLGEVLPRMKEIFEDHDYNAFDEHIEVLTQECNACHAMEDVPFIQVKEPARRLSPVQWEKPE